MRASAFRDSQRTITAGATLVLLLSTIAPAAFSQTAGLFAPSPVSRDAVAEPSDDPTIVRSRSVYIVAQELPDTSWQSGDWVIFNLFDDVELVAELVSLTERGSDDYTWHGKLANASGDMHLTVNGDVVVANIRSVEAGDYQVRYVSGALHDVREVDLIQSPSCGTGPVDAVALPPDSGFASRGTRDAPGIIDVLVLYTETARIAVGGVAAIEAEINMAIDESNTALANSAANPRIRLVHQQEIDYTEQGDSGVVLGQLRGTDDGFMDDIHALRDSVGADNVALIANVPDVCGRAYLMTTLSSGFDAFAFGVVHRTCIAGNFVFLHELGHNWGCAHDHDNATTGLTDYSFGYRFFGNGGGQYRTVMAYSPGARIPQFSNPRVFFDGVRTGVPEGRPDAADNARSINGAANTIANWRQTTTAFSVAPMDDFMALGPVGGPFSPACKTYTLSNVSSSAISWNASSDQAWTSVSPSDGTLGAGASVDVDVCMSAAANALGEGDHDALVTFTNSTAGVSFTRDVRLTVTQPEITTFFLDSDPGWSRQGAWAFGVPQGSGGPTSGATGANVFGYNLSGNYGNDLPERYLTTSPIDCSNAQNVTLRFFRWLGVESSTWDHARVDVSNNGSTWTPVWTHTGGSFNDGQWVLQTFDISSVADGQPAVFVRWTMGATDGSVTYPGWYVDDVRVAGNATSLAEVWVDFSHAGTEQGSSAFPYNTLGEAVDAVTGDGSGIVKIKGNVGVTTSGETLTINKPVTIEAVSGSVRVGAP